MPVTEVRVFRESTGEIPLITWLRHVRVSEPRAFAKCLQRILLLAENGNALRRPHADFLRDGVYELRCRHGRVHYRILYGFTGRCVATLTHGFTKEGKVPDKEIDLAVSRLNKVTANPTDFTAEFDTDNL